MDGAGGRSGGGVAMSVINQILTVIAVVLAGLAVGGLVPGPPGLRRLAPVSAGALGQSGGRRLHPIAVAGAALITPRQTSPPAGQRAALAVAIMVVLPLGLQAVAGLGPITWLLGPIAGGAAYLIAGRLETPAARRRRQQIVDELPSALDLLSAAIAAGLPLRSAVNELLAVSDGPLAEDLRTVLNGVDLGRDEADAWRSLRDHPALGPMSVDLARSVESGTMIAATLQRHAAVARRNRRGEREARARTVGVNSVPPLMLCFVPAFLLISIVPIAAAGILQALH